MNSNTVNALPQNASDAELVVESPAALFQEAKGAFFDTLNSEEQIRFASCSSAEQLISDASSFTKNLERVPATRLLRQVGSFAASIAPYFKCIELVFQSHPEWTCIAWGALRFILQVC
jgi:hypothetical protein